MVSVEMADQELPAEPESRVRRRDETGPGAARFKVVELGHWITGPLAGQVLADFGASVIKVESPDGDPFRVWRGGDAKSPRFAAYNRGKRSMCIDLKQEAGHQILHRVVADADVLICAFRPRVVAELGLNYEVVAREHPRLVACYVSGFGTSGPKADQPGYETSAQALSGLLSTLIDPEAPKAVGPPVVEFVTALYAACAVLDCLFEREVTGYGRRVDVSMLGCALSFMSEPLAVWRSGGEVFSSRSRPAFSQAYMFICKDGEMLALHLSSSEKNWQSLIAVVGSPRELSESARYASREARVANFDDIQQILAPTFATRDRVEWLRALGEAAVPCAPVNRVDQLEDDPQVRALGLIRGIAHAEVSAEFTVVGSPIEGGPGHGAELVVPALGQHTEAVLKDVGYSEQEVAKFVDLGIAGPRPRLRR